jgi:hypothetical protein
MDGMPDCKLSERVSIPGRSRDFYLRCYIQSISRMQITSRLTTKGESLLLCSFTDLMCSVPENILRFNSNRMGVGYTEKLLSLEQLKNLGHVRGTMYKSFSR